MTLNNKDFVSNTVAIFEEEIFQSTKRILMDDYLVFSILDKDDVNREILAEKICDYFEKVELETGKSFENQVKEYMDNLDAIVEDRVARVPKQKKKEKDPVEVSRARKYYEKAIEIKESRNNDLEKLIDYSRIMLCLYVGYIDNNYKYIKDFDLSVDCLDLNKIITNMKKEKSIKLPLIGAREKFNIKNLHSMDTCTFVMTILMLQTIMNEKVWWDK